MEITCPNCGQTCEVDEEPMQGQHLLCPFCDVKFNYTPQNTTENDSNSIANTADPKMEAPLAKIQATCPHCGAVYEVDAAYIGETATCGTCDNPFVIKAAQETQSPDAPADAAAEKAAQTTPGATNGHIASKSGRIRINTLRTKAKSAVNTAKDTLIPVLKTAANKTKTKAKSAVNTAKDTLIPVLKTAANKTKTKAKSAVNTAKDTLIPVLKTAANKTKTAAISARDKAIPILKAAMILIKEKTVALWKNKKEHRKALYERAKTALVAAKNETLNVWRSGTVGKVSILATGSMVVLLFGFWMFWCRGTNSHQLEKSLSVAKTMQELEANRGVSSEMRELEGHDNKSSAHTDYSDRRNESYNDKATESCDIDTARFRQLFTLSRYQAADDSTFNFYGFFLGMSRHDAQALAEVYGLDGDGCYIHADGEKGVSAIYLNIASLGRILRTHNINVQTYNDLAQAVANAVGDLQGRGTRTISGDRWGDRTYYNEQVNQWYERTLINGAYLRLNQQEGLIMKGTEDIRRSMPVETNQAKEQRLSAEKTVVAGILGNMVDIPVKSGMEPFKMAKYEVTQLEWIHVMGKNPSNYMSAQAGSVNSGIRPVENVSLDDCNEFIDALNKLPEVKKSGLVFRLPTAEEWEFACMSGAASGISKIKNGNEVARDNIGEIAWFGTFQTKAAGLKSPNAFGLYDMLGNVAEWTLSWDEEYKDRCICIGGDCSSYWNENSQYDDEKARKYWRESNTTKTKSNHIGLRLCASKNTGKTSVKGQRSFGNSSTIDGITWKYDVIDGAATITGASPKVRELKIPATIGDKRYPVKAIGKSAFGEWKELSRVVIPDSVTTIEYGAFSGIGNAEGGGGRRRRRSEPQNDGETIELVLPKSLTTIGENAFCRCRGLKTLTIPDSVKSISKGAFEYCSNLENLTIGNSVTNICENAFFGCGLASVVIPDSVVDLDTSAFRGCPLTSVTIGNGVTNIGRGAFERLDTLKSVTLGNGVTHIDSQAFNNCRNLASLTIGNSVTSIGPAAFELCEKLKTVKLPDSLKIVGNRAFASCKRLKAMKIPDSVVSIGAGAFEDCAGLASLDIGKRVEIIGKNAFDGCKGLTVVKIPGSVKRIGERAFKLCGLTSVTIGDGVEEIGPWAFWYCSDLTNISIPDSVTAIGEQAFYYCGLETVSIGRSVKSIGDGAFLGCRKLKSVTIPKSVESIGEEAFESCSSLASIIISNPATDIGERAFRGCSNLKNIKAPKELLPLKTE